MELFSSYPIYFLVTIIFPIITGLIMAFAGYEGLKAKVDSDKQLSRIESNTANTLNQLPNINTTLETLNRYEKTLADAGARDEVLGAVLAQYQGMKHASEVREQYRASNNHEEKNQLASEVMEILSTNLIPVTLQPNLPTKPLILGLGANTFKVLFAVPMRIPPELEFRNLPNGVNANVTDKSKFGFSVMFQPLSTNITQFEFSASAEL